MHTSHVVLPGSGWNVPAAHGTQFPCATEGCTVPAAQGVSAVDPVVHMWPNEHSVQPCGDAVTEPRSVAVE